MRPVFRPVAFWQSALMTLPNAAFFDLLRSILGTVKTPFNKQNLVEELSRFIIRPEIQENIAAYIDQNDSKIIAAIALLSEPVPGELESFFTGEYSYAELQGMLLNLEERLIIYRFRDNDVLRIALNPRLENILAPYASDTGVLFPTVAAIEPVPAENEEEPSAPEAAQTSYGVLSGRTLAALFAFLLNNEVQIKDDGNGKDLSFAFRKKATEHAKTLFPGLDINAAAGGLLTLGLLVQKEESVVPDEARIAAFKDLPNRDIFEYLAGGIALFIYRNGLFAPYQSRGLLRNTVKLIHAISNLAKDGTILPEATMIKMAELFRRQEESNWDYSGGVPPVTVLLKSLVMAGLFSVLTIDGTNYYRPKIPAKAAKAPSAKEHPLIAMDSGFSCVLYPEISFADALDMSAFSFVEETGTAIRFALSRESVVRGFDRGYTAEVIWKMLDRLSGGRAPDALKWNLNDWEKRWQEVSLNQGVILTLSGERSYLAQTGRLASMIKQTLAPGIYLLSVGIDDAADALHSAGVDIVARPGSKPDEYSSQFFAPLGKPETISLPGNITEKKTATGKKAPGKEDAVKEKETAENSAEQIKQKFRLALEKMKLTKQEQEELESRIERRVIVSETQLKDTSLRYERLEARSLDYVGKTGIVRQAISTGSLLELSCLNGEKILGKPESLDKKGNEMILTIKPREGGEPVKLTLGKISLVRRIKQSIFGE